MARGVAFQLVEALGVLERQKVAEEVKGLDQPARATLRKYGVRFGAYHIYLPALLKPAPRALATQLWAIKHESPGCEGRRRIAASRRQRPHVDPGRQGNAESALPDGRLPHLRRARGARRYSRAPRRSHPARTVMARRRPRPETGRFLRRPQLPRERRDDVPHRRVRRRLCIDLAFAWISDGSQAEVGGGASSTRGSGRCPGRTSGDCTCERDAGRVGSG